jgi:hypothetical protein
VSHFRRKGNTKGSHCLSVHHKTFTLPFLNISSSNFQIIATLRKHSLPTQPCSRGRESIGLQNDHFQIRHHKQQKREPERLPFWNGQWQKICNWGFKPGSLVHLPHTCPYRFSKLALLKRTFKFIKNWRLKILCLSLFLRTLLCIVSTFQQDIHV